MQRSLAWECNMARSEWYSLPRVIVIISAVLLSLGGWLLLVPRPPRDVMIFCHEHSRINRLVFSPDSCYLAGACLEGDVLLWDVARKCALWVVKGHSGD